MVDMTLQRHVLHLGSTQHQDYAAGKSRMQFAVPQIDISGLKRSWLNNVGLLLVWLWSHDALHTSTVGSIQTKLPSLQMLLKDQSGEQIVQVSMVTQVCLQVHTVQPMHARLLVALRTEKSMSAD